MGGVGVYLLLVSRCDLKVFTAYIYIYIYKTKHLVCRTYPPLDSTPPFWRATEYDLGHSSIPRWHASMCAPRRQGVLGVVRCGTGPSSQGCVLTPLLFNKFFAAATNVASTCIKADKGVMDALVHLRKKREARGRGKATAGESVLAVPLWGMLYADDAGVSQSPEQPRKMMKVIVVACAAFRLTVWEAKTEIMCLRAKGMLESTTIFSVKAAGQVYSQTNEFVYLGGNVNHNADLSIEFDRRIRNAWCSSRKYTLELYDRTSASLELKIRMLRVEVLETILYGCVTWSPRACLYDTLRRAHHRFLSRCIGW